MDFATSLMELVAAVLALLPLAIGLFKKNYDTRFGVRNDCLMQGIGAANG